MSNQLLGVSALTSRSSIVRMVWAALVLIIAIMAALNLSGASYWVVTLLSSLALIGGYFSLARNHPQIILLLPATPGLLLLLLSSASLELGGFAPEIGEVGRQTGATLRLVALLGLFLVGMCSVPTMRVKPMNINSPRADIVTWRLFIALFVILIVNGVIYGIPILSGVQRFYYWIAHPFGSLLSKILAVLPVVVMYLSLRNSLGSKYVTVRRMLVSILLSVLVGYLYSNKASFFILLFLSALVGPLWATQIRGGSVFRAVGRYVPHVIVASVSVLALVYSSYMYIHGYIPSEAKAMLSQRILNMQAQLWWAIDLRWIEGGRGVVRDLFSKDENSPYGIYVLMSEVMSADSFGHYFRNKIPLTGGFPANIVWVFGYVGALPILLMAGYVYGLVLRYVSLSMVNGRIESILLFVVYSGLIWALSLGSFNSLVSPLFIAALIVSLWLSATRRTLARSV